MTHQDIVSATRAFIVENFLYTRPDAQLDDDELLIEKRILDSMGMVELLTFLEDSFGVQPADDEITESNFGSLARIAGYVSSKQPGRLTV